MRLSLVYATGVAMILLAVLFGLERSRALRELPELMIPIGVCFGVALVVLATARRWGFIALWMLLSAFWGWELAYAAHGPRPGVAFFGWSILAAPLYFIVALGFRSASGSRPRSSSRTFALVFLGWAMLAFAAVQWEYAPDWNWPFWSRALWTVLKASWFLFPIAIGATAVVRIRRAAVEATPNR